MSPINLAIVGLRLLSVYCFIQSVPLFASLGFVVPLWGRVTFDGSTTAAAITMLFPYCLRLLLAVLLFKYSEPLARRFAPAVSAEPQENTCTFEQVQGIAFAVAGILILTTALPGVGRALQGLVSLYAQQKQGSPLPTGRSYESWMYCTGVAAQVVVGLLLLLNPKGFRNAWRWLRTAGT